MSKRIAAILLALLCAGQAAAASAAAKPIMEWVASSEYYLVLPAPQNLRLTDISVTERVNPWGFGLKAVGHETFTKTAALQVQAVKVNNPTTGVNTFYLFELLAGMQYLSPRRQGMPMRITAAGLAEFGLSDTTLYMAPVLSLGLLYSTDLAASSPTGFTLDVYYRFTDIDLDNVGNNRKGTLQPALGLKMGYVFEGFWRQKEKR